MGTFPGKPETNPKAPCNVILASEGDEPLVENIELQNDGEFPTQANANGEKTCVEVVTSKDSYALKKSLEDPKEKFLKIIALVEEEERLEKEALKASHEASKPHTQPMPKILTTKESPGKFNVPVCLGGRVFKDALCDSGSYVNVISWDLVKELNLKGMKPHTTPLTFGDASKKIPKGMIEKCPVFVGDCLVESDLLVLDMVDSSKQPLLLGVPFLLSTGAVIDYVNKEMVLKHVDEKVSYALTQERAFCGTVMVKDTIIEPKEVFTVETATFELDKLEFEKTLKVEVPLQEEATSRDVKTKLMNAIEESKVKVTSSLVMEMLDAGKKLKDKAPMSTADSSKGVEAVSFLDSSNLELEKLFKEEVLLKKGVKKVEVAKRAKKKKLKQAQHDFKEARPHNLTFKPLTLVDGKLDCQVQCKGYSKPFHKVRILFDPTSPSKDNSSKVTDKMANLFGMKLDDPGPFQGGSSTST